MTKVTWMPAFSEKVGYESNITYYEPESAFKYLVSVRNQQDYLKCPALSAFLKNTFVIKSPYDLKLNIDTVTQNVTSNKFGQEFITESIDVTPAKYIKDNLTIQTFPKYLFVSNSKTPVIISLMPWFFKPNNFNVIPGSFDITKWIRPVHLSVEINNQTELEFNRGEPLFCVKFETKDTVVLERGIFTESLKEAMTACLNTKKYAPSMNLNTLYSISSEYIQMNLKRFFKNQ